MRAFATFALFSHLSCACFGHELSDALGKDVAVSKTSKAVRVEYCPDNTCEVFSLKGKESVSLQDFAFVYLFSVSEYIYLQRFQAEQNAPYVQSVLSKYRTECPQSSEQVVARCVVSVLAKRYPIKASFVRYDEGTKNTSSISLGAYRRGT